jgi:hypothetical protein
MKLKSRKFPKVWNSAIRGRGGGRYHGVLNYWREKYTIRGRLPAVLTQPILETWRGNWAGWISFVSSPYSCKKP